MKPYLKIIWFVLAVATIAVLFYSMPNIRIQLSAEEPKPPIITQGPDGRLHWHGAVAPALVGKPAYVFRSGGASGMAFVPTEDSLCSFMLVANGEEVFRVEADGRMLAHGRPIKGDKELVEALEKVVTAYRAEERQRIVPSWREP